MSSMIESVSVQDALLIALHYLSFEDILSVSQVISFVGMTSTVLTYTIVLDM